VWESAAFLGFFLASGFSCTQSESTLRPHAANANRWAVQTLPVNSSCILCILGHFGQFIFPCQSGKHRFVKRKFLFYSIVIGPLILMNLLWSIYRPLWLYWFSRFYLGWEIIVVGCLLIFAPQKVVEIKAFIENIENQPLLPWSEKHFTYIYLGIIILALGGFVMNSMIQAYINNIVP
jgi:hypothetical protein